MASKEQHIKTDRDAQSSDDHPISAALDPRQFLRAWQLAAAAADGDVDVVESRVLLALSPPRTVDASTARVLAAVRVVFRESGLDAMVNATRRLFELYRLIEAGHVDGWLARRAEGFVVRIALIYAAAGARFDVDGFDLQDLDARATALWGAAPAPRIER